MDKTEPVLNSKVEIKGSVSPAAPGAAVALHVRYQGRHHWKTIDSGRLSSASKYRFKDKVGSVRTRKYRVVMVAGANRSAGHSPAIKVTVFGWRNLTSLDPVIGQNLYESGKATINGVPYESSITGGTGRLDYNLVRDCKRLDAVYGLSDSSEAAGSTTLALTERAVSWLEERAAQRAPAGHSGFLRIPHHGRHRPHDDRHRVLRRIPVVARQAHHHALVPADRAIRLVARLHRGAVRLDHHRAGRQPWIAYGILRTADAISPVTAASVLTTLILFVIVYGIVFTMGIYYINRLIVRGPQGRAVEPPEPRHAAPAAAARRAKRRASAKRREAEMEWYLPVIWAGLIGTAVALYVILDGFDLGIGILFPFAKEEQEKDQMIDTIAPFWDGNETWLVLGGGGLWVAFPQAYAVVMPALYLPVIVMLLALVFRGVAFEFRTVAVTSKKYWNFAFAGGSTLAAFCQGLILGGLIQGIKVENGAFAGGTFDFATPFALLCGFGVVTGYALLGACWLAMKTEGAVAERARAHAKTLLLACWCSWRSSACGRRSRSRASASAGSRCRTSCPVAGPGDHGAHGLLRVALARAGARRSRRSSPRSCCSCSVIVGLAISVLPYLVPPSMTIWDAAAAPASQIFMLIGTLPLLPIILIYTGFVYYIFRGKLKEGEGYH